MPKQAKGLTVKQVQALTKPGFHADGGGLYVQVTPAGGKTWVFRYQLSGRRRMMGLGSVALVTLAEAREKALAARKMVVDGTDPIEAKQATPTNAPHAVSTTPTFEAVVGLYIEAKRAGWRSDKHTSQWANTLRDYAFPAMGALPIDEITTEHVLSVLTPIWVEKPETAGRVRGRIEAILDYGKARGWRSGENPARWKGHLALTLPAKAKVHKVVGHASLPYQQMPAFWLRLQAADGMGARALEFAILTATRTSEVLGALWSEIDMGAATWTVPAARMKAGAEHRVPLSAPALALLRRMATVRQGEYVFPGQVAGRPLSNMAMKAALRRMGRDDLTPHGFRSTFRTWAAEMTSAPHEICEAALAHTPKDKVVSAYQRGDLLDKRRRLMEQWAAYVTAEGQGANVLPMARPGA